MPTVIAQIKKWANDLPYWEQAALDKVLSGASLGQNDYEELLDYLLQDVGLTNVPQQRPKLKHLDTTNSSVESSSGPIVLNKIFNMHNINALVSGQILTFCPQLTAIFGENASGKSGYARVLGCAGFTRGDKQVLPDITKPFHTDMVISADIEISDGGSTEIINYKIGDQCAKLSQCYVFDSTSVHIHLTGSNAFSFAPAGLFVLTRLAEITDKVRLCLQAKIDMCRQPHSFSDLFQGNSPVTDFIQTLGLETKLDELTRLATLTKEENNRVSQLDYEIASLKTKDVPQQLSRLTQTIKDLEKLVKRLQEIELLLNDESIKEIRFSIQQYLKRDSLSKSISIDQFKSKYFTQVGSEVWQRFIIAAKDLADTESSKDKPYPQIDNRCLLCRQPLDVESYNFLLNLWKYLESDAQLKLDQSHKILRDKRSTIAAIDLSFFNDQTVSYRHIQGHDIELLKRVIIFVEACLIRRDSILGIIDSHKDSSLLSLPSNEVININKMIENLNIEFNELEKQDITNKIIALGQELLTIQHRQILFKNLTNIKNYVINTKWAKRASTVGGDTRHITSKHKQLFKDLVTNQYMELFNSLLKDLQRPINVKVKTLGKKGRTFKQIVLEMDPTMPIDYVTPDKVLSEGEKRAVALADFLTEVALDTTSSAIILDDPVTSLDLEWKETIASILAKESKNHQIILFTHDLPFLYFVKKYSQENQIEIVTHWIQRVKNRPGYVFLNNSPALEKEYCKPTRAREFYELAMHSVADQQENYLRLGFGALRTCYEAFIIYDLFQGVVLRFDRRVSPGRLKGIKWDQSIATEVNTKYENLSPYIEGHLPSDGYIAKPTPDLLLNEIQSFEALRRNLKKLKANSRN